MPIRPEFRSLYPPNWSELSERIRFERAGGRCQGCGRPHLGTVRCLPDGRWFDESEQTWRDRRGRSARWPDLIDAGHFRLTRVVLAAAHLDNNPANNRLANLRSLCQRCHLLHDLPFHRVQRWLTFRRRWAVGDLFLGLYEMQMSLPFLVKPTGAAVILIRGDPRQSWRSAQLPMTARAQRPSAVQLPLISMGGRARGHCRA